MDGLVIARFLVSELIAGETENGEALGVVFLVELFEGCVLWGECAFAGHVDDEEDLAAKVVEGTGLSLDILGGELVDVVHHNPLEARRG